MSKNDIRTLEGLEQHISFTSRERQELEAIIKSHPMAVTQYYMDLIDWNDPDDPIRRMVIPSVEEKQLEGSFDTSGERENTKFRGLQHKYPQTALILTTNSCFTHCRYCFRKRLVGVSADEVVVDWDRIVEYLCEHKEITNVLLSGGDPLTLPTTRIADALQRLSGIQHLKFIRIGTRTPVVFPSRVIEDDKLIEVLRECSREDKRIYVITHFNHPKEITSYSTEAVNRLADARIAIGNQTVLLKGVNDNPAIMAELQSALTEIGVAPYYVFQCRSVSRVKNIFQVPLSSACRIIEETRSMLDGVSKRFRFVMSHETGKIEVLGIADGRVYFKYHQSKDEALRNKVFHRKLDEDVGWFDG